MSEVNLPLIIVLMRYFYSVNVVLLQIIQGY
jgi:hypothetical protein